MKFLIIETSGEDSFVALSIHKRWTLTPLPAREQMSHLLPEIVSLLASSGLKLDDLDFIAIGNGPGSFTGTRIGVLTAKTLSFAKSLPLIAFCSLRRFTPSCNQTPFLILIDAKSHGLLSYDGKKVTLRKAKTLEIPEKCLLLSPHPQKIQKEIPLKIAPSSLNLLLLINHLEKQFKNGQTISPKSLQVSYLYAPYQ